jgi:negative regulator of sigma E activity
MTCREASKLLALFFDGELDARQMRVVALHNTRCSTCEPELRQLEHLQELISETVNARVDEVDLTKVWPGVDQQLGSVRLSWWERGRVWWSEGEHEWMARLPALAAAAAVVILAVVLLTRTSPPTPQPAAPQLAENAVSIESLISDSNAVTMLDDPQTPVLWISEEVPMAGDAP